MLKSFFKNLIIVITIISPLVVYADGVMVTELPGNTVIPMQQNYVRMLKEVVKVNSEKVDAIFTFKNTSNKDIKFEMGFPIPSNMEFSSGQQFIAQINKRNVVVTRKKISKSIARKIGSINGSKYTSYEIIYKGGKPYKLSRKVSGSIFDYDIVYTWKIFIKPKEKKIVECIYPVQWYSDPAQPDLISRFDYVTKTGALWKGNIEQADFYIDIQGVRPMDVKQKKVRLDITPKGYKIINYKTIEWHFRNWEPTEDIHVEFYWNYKK